MEKLEGIGIAEMSRALCGRYASVIRRRGALGLRYLGRVSSAHRQPHDHPPTSWRTLLRVLGPYAQPHRRTFLLGLGLTLLGVACQLAIPWPIRELVLQWSGDAAPPTANSWVHHVPAGLPPTVLLASLFLGAMFLAGFFDHAQRLQFARFAIGWARDLRAAAWRGSTQLPKRELRTHSGELVARLVSDVARFKAGVKIFLVYVGTNLVLLVGATLVVFVQSRELGFVFAGATLAVGVVAVLGCRGTRAAWFEYRQHEGLLAGSLEADGAGADVAAISRASGDAETAEIRRQGLSTWAAYLILGLTMLATLSIGSSLVQQGRLEVSVLFVVLAYTLFLARPVVRLARHGTRTGKLLACGERLYALVGCCTAEERRAAREVAQQERLERRAVAESRPPSKPRGARKKRPSLFSRDALAKDGRRLHRMARFYRPVVSAHRRWLLLGAGAALAMVGLRLALPWLLADISATVLGEAGPALGSGTAIFHGALFLALFAALGASDFLSRLWFARLAIESVHQVRADLDTRDAPVPGKGSSKGDFMTRLVGDTARLKEGLKGFLVHVATNGALFLGVVLILLRVDVRLSLLMGAALLLTGLVTSVGGLRIWRRARRIRQQEGQLAETIRVASSGSGNNTSRRDKEGAVRGSRGTAKATLTQMQGRTTWAVHGLFAVTVLTCLWFATHGDPARRLDGKDLFLFMAYAMTLYHPVMRLTRQGTRAGKILACADRLEQALGSGAQGRAVSARGPSGRMLPGVTPAPSDSDAGAVHG